MKSTGTLVALIAILGGAGCGDADPPVDDGSHRGELRIYRVSYDDGRVEREFYLSPDARSSEVTKLVFPADPELAPWTRLKVWGERDAEEIRVSRYAIDTEAEVEDSTKTHAESLIGAPQRTRTVGFVLADVGGGVNISAADAQTTIFGTRNGDPGLWEYYLDASYGTLRFTGEVLGPTMVTDLGSCDTASVVRIENRWASTFGKTFQHWMTYIGSRYSNCGWGGIGGEGTAARPAYGSWYNASTGCVVLAQEIGHNLGLNHAGTMDCGTSTIMPDDPRNGCTGTEYGNRYTPMGGGCLHMNAYEKWYEGFMGGCNGVKVRSSGTFTLLPIAQACNGVQALQIPMAKQRAFRNTTGSRDVTLNYYYLELRTRLGLDDRGNNGPVTQPTVLVHVVGDVPQPSVVSTFTWQLDMVPNTNPFDGMASGQTFTDPAGGVSFTVQALSAERATINVDLQNGTGANTCIDGSTFATPGPDSCGMGGSSGTGGAGGTGGTAGAGGSSGSGGTAGSAGTGGTSGASGGGTSGTGAAGGASGSNGSGGASSAGAAGTGGASGIGGTTGGTAGTGTSGGHAGVGGDGGAVGAAGSGAAATGGSNTAGTSGATSAGGTRSRPPNSVDLNDDEGSCACRTAGGRSNAWGLVLVPLLGMLPYRRRARSRQA